MPWLVLPGGIGFALGSLLLNRWETRLSRPVWIAYGLAMVGLATALLAVAIGGDRWIHLLLSVGMITAVGFSLAPIILPSRAILEERPPAEMRGRVISTQLALGNAAAIVPLLLGGTLADAVGLQPVMAFVALLALLAGLAGLRQARTGVRKEVSS
jgi:MFS family permease